MPSKPQPHTCPVCETMFLVSDPRPSRAPKVRYCSSRCRREGDWVGRRVGQQTVTALTDDPRKVMVRCDCGSERAVACASLNKADPVTSCGCASQRPRPAEWPDKIAKGGDDECWEFQGARNAGGYGIAGCGLVHREVYRREVEEPGGLMVLHRCDNPACCNPAHLYLGDNAQNMLDMKTRGRQRSLKGAENPNAKLTPDQVAEIRRRYASDRSLTQDVLAREYGVSQQTIGNVVRHRTYRRGAF